MSQAFDVEATIDRPIDVVWSALTDWDNAHRWMSGIDSLAAEGGLEPGTKLTFRARGKDRHSEIVQVEPGRSITLRSVQGGVTADYRYQLTPEGDSATTARLVAECRTSGLPWSLIGPLLRIVVRRTDGGQMNALKPFAEARP